MDKHEPVVETRSKGRVAFEAYREFRGGRNHDGSPTPTWEQLSQGVRDAWEVAAQVVLMAPVASIP